MDWFALVKHSVVYTATIYVMSLVLGAISIVGIGLVLLSHVLIDRGGLVRWWVISINNGQLDNVWLRFMVDQSLHILVLIGVLLI